MVSETAEGSALRSLARRPEPLVECAIDRLHLQTFVEHHQRIDHCVATGLGVFPLVNRLSETLPEGSEICEREYRAAYLCIGSRIGGDADQKPPVAPANLKARWHLTGHHLHAQFFEIRDIR